ncbi:MAG: hypothetical protein AB7E70_13600 [Hyphomicrobiaceae bacterium]
MRATLAVLLLLFIALPAPARERTPVIGIEAAGGPLQATMTALERQAWGEKWPFVADRAWLVCVPELQMMGVYLVVGGEVFALTGGTQAMARQHRIRVIVDGRARTPRLFNIETPGVDALWRERPRPPGLRPDEPWLKVSIGPVIAAAGPLGCR